jgi:hypothetical protein
MNSRRASVSPPAVSRISLIPTHPLYTPPSVPTENDLCALEDGITDASMRAGLAFNPPRKAAFNSQTHIT